MLPLSSGLLETFLILPCFLFLVPQVLRSRRMLDEAHTVLKNVASEAKEHGLWKCNTMSEPWLLSVTAWACDNRWLFCAAVCTSVSNISVSNDTHGNTAKTTSLTLLEPLYDHTFSGVKIINS